MAYRFELRPYQRAAVDALYRCWEEGHGDNPLIVVPTGGGKSVILATLCAEALEWPGTRICVVTHRAELVEQDARAIQRMIDEPVGIYSAGVGAKDRWRSVTVASIQSIYREAPRFDPWDIIVVDECHMIPPRSNARYTRFLNEARLQNPHLKIVGLTATPFRMGAGMLHEGTGALFDVIAYEIQIHTLIRDGFLSEVISRGGVRKIDTSGVQVRGGEYVAQELARAADDPDVTRAAVAEIVRYGQDRRGWLVFAAGVEHAYHIAEELRGYGVATEVVTGDTPKVERARILRGYKAGRIRCVVNVEVLTTGFDAPHTDLLGMLRPTKSPVLYVQMVGRGMRTADGKRDCLLLDFAGVVAEHGPVDQVRVRSRGSRNGRSGAAPTKECPECQRILHASVRECPDCGHIWDVRRGDPELERRAYGGAVLSFQSKVEVLEVSGMYLERWEPADPTRPDTLRITYQAGLRRVSEWVCPEHPTGSYARRKFEERCRKEWGIEPPATIKEALQLDIDGRIPRPARIRVYPNKSNPKYLDVLSREYDDA